MRLNTLQLREESAILWLIGKKVRDKRFMAAVEEESLPEKAVCVVCKQRESTVRCRFCGPAALGSFFWSTCAHDLHVGRNQFHVLDQWKVFSNRHVYTFYVLEMEKYFFLWKVWSLIIFRRTETKLLTAVWTSSQDNRFIPLFSNHGAIESGHSCSSRVLKMFKLIDAFGELKTKSKYAQCELSNERTCRKFIVLLQ